MKRTSLLLAALALPAMLLFAACGDDDEEEDAGAAHTASAHVEATNPRAQSSGNDVGAVYATLTNHGDKADYLLSAEVLGDHARQVGMVQIHEVVTEGTSSKMQQIQKLEIPANGSVELKSGSYHIMLMNVNPPLAEGDILEVKLNFELAEAVTIKATVAKPGAGASTGMSSGMNKN